MDHALLFRSCLAGRRIVVGGTGDQWLLDAAFHDEQSGRTLLLYAGWWQTDTPQPYYGLNEAPGIIKPVRDEGEWVLYNNEEAIAILGPDSSEQEDALQEHRTATLLEREEYVARLRQVDAAFRYENKPYAIPQWIELIRDQEEPTTTQGGDRRIAALPAYKDGYPVDVLVLADDGGSACATYQHPFFLTLIEGWGRVAGDAVSLLRPYERLDRADVTYGEVQQFESNRGPQEDAQEILRRLASSVTSL